MPVSLQNDMVPAAAPPLLEARRLSRRYGHRAALDNVDVHLPAGHVLGVYGPNGSGKTTLLRMLAGTLQPTSGTVLLRGADLYSGPRRMRRRLGFVPEQAPVDDSLTVQAQLLLWTRLHGIKRDRAGKQVEAAAQALGITPLLQQRAGTLSHGQRRLLCLARALAAGPEVLLLDEPFEGLDGTGRSRVQLACRQHSGRGALVISSHQLEHLLELCRQIMVLREGRCLGLVANPASDTGRTTSERIQQLLDEASA